MTFPLATLLLAEGSNPLGGLLPFVLMIAVFYFLVLRPMSKQEKDRKVRMGALKRGDEIVLTGGVLGRISRIEPDDEVAIIEIADRVKIRVLKKDISDLASNAIKVAGEKKDDKKEAKKDEPEAEPETPGPDEARRAG